MEVRRCQVCDGKFKPTKNKQKYCSGKCRTRAYRTRQENKKYKIGGEVVVKQVPEVLVENIKPVSVDSMPSCLTFESLMSYDSQVCDGDLVAPEWFLEYQSDAWNKALRSYRSRMARSTEDRMLEYYFQLFLLCDSRDGLCTCITGLEIARYPQFFGHIDKVDSQGNSLT